MKKKTGKLLFPFKLWLLLQIEIRLPMKIFEFIRRHKYILTIALFALILLFGNGRIFTNREMKQKIKEKEKVIEQERAKIDSLDLYIENLQQNPLLQEEYIRNRYHMKKPDEDIFFVSRPDNSDKKKAKQ